MSDDTPKKLPEVAQESSERESIKFDKLLTQKEIKRLCPECGYSDFWLLEDGSRQSILIAQNYGMIPVYTISCMNCGYVRQFFRDVLNGKVAKPPREDPS